MTFSTKELELVAAAEQAVATFIDYLGANNAA